MPSDSAFQYFLSPDSDVLTYGKKAFQLPSWSSMTVADIQLFARGWSVIIPMCALIKILCVSVIRYHVRSTPGCREWFQSRMKLSKLFVFHEPEHLFILFEVHHSMLFVRGEPRLRCTRIPCFVIMFFIRPGISLYDNWYTLHIRLIWSSRYNLGPWGPWTIVYSRNVWSTISVRNPPLIVLKKKRSKRLILQKINGIFAFHPRCYLFTCFSWGSQASNHFEYIQILRLKNHDC